MHCWLRLCAFAWIAVLCAHSATAGTTIYYPRQGYDNPYQLKVLQLALREADMGYDLKPSALDMSQSRALEQLAKGKMVDVYWSMTSIEREEALLPIRIPIEKGLLGWRLLLTHRNAAQNLSKVRSVEDLRRLKAGQGHDWPDTQILRFNALPVEVGTSYEGLFDMLDRNRFDYFPRSVIEVWDDIRDFPRANIELDRSIAIHYPTAMYFFVNKSNTPLAKAIETGLNRAIANGSFERLFQESFAKAIKSARFKERIRLELNNPILPPATPLARKDLWITF